MGAVERARELAYEQLAGRKAVAELRGREIGILPTSGGYLVVTEDTVYLATVNQAGLFRTHVKRYSIDKITSVDIVRPPLGSVLEVGTAEGVRDEDKLFVERSREAEARQVADLILKLKAERRTRSSQQAQATGSIPEQIKQLAELRDAGILSVQEFEDKKAELLTRM
jgi:hypothetical protein